MVAEENFEFTGAAKRKIITYLIVGVVLLGFGILGLSKGWWGTRDAGHGHGGGHAQVEATTNDLLAAHEEGHAHGEAEAHAEGDHGHGGHGHGEYSFWLRVKMSLWHNAIFFLGIGLCGVFFLAVNYITWAGWSALIKRVFEAFGAYLLPGGIIVIALFFAFNHDIFHWTHEGLYEEGTDTYDPIIAGKAWYLGMPFYIGRMVVFIGAWILFWRMLRKESQLEDMNGGVLHHNRQINWSAGFVVFFAVSSSMAAWDWIMSIDTHWFSTMFGWYVFASWFVSALSAISFIVVRLKDIGLLKQVNAEHFHDLGKFMFAFSIFWTYVWLSQFLLYWYSNIPEESIWFVERMFNNMGVYAPIFVLNLIVNFLFPFLFFMTSDSKRAGILLKVGAVGLIIGHWLDFYLMMMPGTLKEHGGLDLGILFVELGIAMVFVCIFAYSILHALGSRPLIAKNHPFLQESIHHHT